MMYMSLVTNLIFSGAGLAEDIVTNIVDLIVGLCFIL